MHRVDKILATTTSLYLLVDILFVDVDRDAASVVVQEDSTIVSVSFDSNFIHTSAMLLVVGGADENLIENA